MRYSSTVLELAGGAAFCLLMGRGCPVIPPPAVTAPGSEAFVAELQKYSQATKPLREKAQAEVPKGSSPEKQAAALEKRRAILGDSICRLRAGAKQGDLFTAEGATYVKQAITSAFSGPATTTLRDALEEQNDPTIYKGPLPKVALNTRINAPLLPAVLTVDLPPLPKEVEYRFSGRTLVLTDAEAICVLDYIPDALPEAPRAPPGTSTASAPPLQTTSFLSMPQRPRSLRFAVLGDTGTGGPDQRKLAETFWTYYSQGNRFKFILLLGDNLYAGLELASDYRRQFLDPYKAFLDARVRFHAALGNHDLAGQVDFPPFSMEGKPYYSFHDQNATFVALNSNEPSDPAQREWLDKQFSDNGDWRICFFHHPLFSSGTHALESKEMRAWLEEDLVRNRVNVVFSGHEHFYERIKPQRGIQYFVNGSAAKIRLGDLRPQEFTDFGYDRENIGMIVEIAGDSLFYQALGVSGRTVDCGVIYRTPEAATKADGDDPTRRWLRSCLEARRWLRSGSDTTTTLSQQTQ
jgi:hypothetical protein